MLKLLLRCRSCGLAHWFEDDGSEDHALQVIRCPRCKAERVYRRQATSPLRTGTEPHRPS